MQIKKSKLVQKAANETVGIESYHVEECDGKTQHWIIADDGYWFPEHETISVCGFSARDMVRQIKAVRKDDRDI